jgi:hypothetical protein
MPRRLLVVALATVAAIAPAVVAAESGDRTLGAGAPTCRSDTAHASACAFVAGFFDALQDQRYGRACSYLGEELRRETGVEVTVFIDELGHYRPLRWLAVVAREHGRMQILSTVQRN